MKNEGLYVKMTNKLNFDGKNASYFLSNSVAFATFLLGHVLKSKFCLFFRLSFFSLPCPLAAVIGPLLGLLPVKKLLSL